MLKQFFLGQAVAPIESIGNVLDDLFTSDKERLDKQVILTRLAQKPHILQAEITKIEAGQRTLFVAGWRPFIGWVCGIALAYSFILRDVIMWLMALMGLSIPMPLLNIDALTTLLYALLGLGGLRTYEKISGRAR